jgi:glycosyltransferase 2 family protein
VKRLFIFLGWAVLLVSVTYVAIAANKHFDSLPSFDWSMETVVAATIAISVYAAAIVIWSFGWAILLQGLGEKTGMLSAFTIIGISQITKYIPGNIAHHVGRVVLAKHDGLSTSRVASSMVLEFFLLVAASASCAIIALAVSGASVLYSQYDLNAITILAVVIVAIGIPAGVVTALKVKKPAFLFDHLPVDHLKPPGLLTSIINFATHFANFLLQGAVIVILGAGVFEFEVANYWLSVGVFSLAWLAGFIAPGAPAGLGVRDAILIAGLSLVYPTGDAIAVAATHRVVTVIGDVVIFAGALALRRTRNEVGSGKARV